jgi:membrane-bound serine protease (ClpP class)
MMRRWFVGLTIVSACLAAALPANAQANVAGYLELTGLLDEPSISFLEREVTAAQEGRVAALIVRIDSPGALDAAIAPAVEAIRSSRVPVIVWVAAGEAQAGSAAAALALSAHHLVMAPRATIGPAVPLDLKGLDQRGGQERSIDRRFLADVAASSERDLDTPALTALEREAIPAERARDLGLADAIAPNVQELLASLQGETVRSRSGTVTFSEQPFTLRFVKMTLLERLVHSAARPAFAYLLLLLGIFGLIFELYNPGIGAAGLGGGVALMFGFHAFTELPTSWPALAAVLVGLALLSMDLKTSSLGPFSVAGLLALAGGSLLLYAGAHPVLRMPLWAAFLGVAMTLVFFLQVMTSAIRARTAKPLPGADGIMGAVGIARTDISPDGQVMARGTLWRARTLGAAIGQGTPVKVRGISGLMLMVEPTSELPPEEA